MKASWMAGKAERLKLQMREARKMPMPEDKRREETAELVTAWLMGNKVKRATTGKRTMKAPQGHTGMMPDEAYGNAMKCKPGRIELWTGGKAPAGKTRAASPQPSVAKLTYDQHYWPIVKRA